MKEPPQSVRKLLFMLALGVAAVAVRATTIAPDHPNLQYFGRWDFSAPAKPVTGWPGTGWVAAFSGTSLRATFTEDNSNNRLEVTVDDGSPITVRLARGTSTVVLAQGLANTAHRVKVVKKTEGCCGAANFAFLGLQLDAAANLLPPPPRPPLRIEVYGDSHAAGFSAECSCDSQDTAYKNAAYAYPALLGRLLGAEVHNQSWSGIGIFSGYATKTMPEVFDRTLQGNASPLWTFARYTPDAVVINLGDNDVLKGATKAQIKGAIQGFVRNQLRPRYPLAHLVIAASYGWSFQECANYVDEIANELNAAGDARVSWVKLPWLSGQAHRVYCEHAGHANLLGAHLASRLGLPAPTPLPLSCLPDPGTVTNGDLERDTLPADPGPDGWRPFVSRGTVALLTSTAPAGAPGAAQSGRCYVQLNPKGGYAGIYQATEAVAGRTYTATASLRKATSGTGSGWLRIEFCDQAQNQISQQVTATPVDSTWRPFTVTGQAPPNTWHLRVVAVSDSGAVIDVDTLSLASN